MFSLSVSVSSLLIGLFVLNECYAGVAAKPVSSVAQDSVIRPITTSSLFYKKHSFSLNTEIFRLYVLC